MDTSNFVTSSNLTGVAISLLFFILICAGAIYQVHTVTQEHQEMTERNIRLLDAENVALREELALLSERMNQDFAILSRRIAPLASLHAVGTQAMRGRRAMASADEEITSVERQVVGRVDQMRREQEAMHAYVERRVGEIRGRLVTFR
ncbi:MAG: hypothetical protein M3Y58_07115 [Chloroflexota bacterium]|nr:hypothetical protein [Chloroflexota bacterium]